MPSECVIHGRPEQYLLTFLWIDHVLQNCSDTGLFKQSEAIFQEKSSLHVWKKIVT